jgi:general secretion pathway protein C
VAVSILVILLAFQAAGLTWRLLDRPAVQDAVPPAVVIATDTPISGASGNFDSLRNWTPFGSAPEPVAGAIPAEVVLDGPLTNLQLRLTSTMQRQALPERGSMVIPESGSAIIDNRGQQKVYRTGEAIQDTNGTTLATLHSVFVDRVLLDRGGGQALERLELPKADATAQNAGRPNPNARQAAIPPFRAPQPLDNAATVAATEVASSAAAAFGQHIQLRLQLDGDQAIGFRVEPRGDSPVLSRLGLEPGDVLTQVNGVGLGDLRNVTAVLEALGQSPQANVTIRRNGIDQGMVIDIGQIQRLAESLQ